MADEIETKVIHALAGQLLDYLDSVDHSEQNKIAALRVAATTIEETFSAHQWATARANMAWNMRKR